MRRGAAVRRVRARAPSLRRGTVWIAAAAAVPFLIALGAEWVLRSKAAQRESSFFQTYEIQGETMMVENPDFGLSYFPPALNREPEPFAFPARKKEGVCRIVLLGASAAMGDPKPSFGFGRFLERMLEGRYPGVRFEVIHAGMTAINSHAVRVIAREAVRHEPDWMIVYLGNNEVVGPFGAGSVFTGETPPLWMIRARLALERFAAGRAFREAVEVWMGNRPGPSEWKGLEMWDGGRFFVERGNPALETVYGHFKRNLADICEAAAGRSIPLTLCTVAVNLRDFAPLASADGSDLGAESREKRDRWYDEAITLQEAAEWESALECLERAAAIDGEHAGIRFRIAQCRLKLGRTGAAEDFSLARDLDALRFRADSRINRAIRETARRFENRGVQLVDVERSLADRSEGGVPGGEWFHEHVHFNLDGNHAVAEMLLESGREMLPGGVLAKDSGRPALTAGECKDRLGFTFWERYRLTELILERISRPPFAGRAGNRERVDELARDLTSYRRMIPLNIIHQVRAQYEAAIERYPDDWMLNRNYARMLSASGNPAEAAGQMERVCAAVPQHAEAWHDLGVAHLESGNIEAAVRQFEKALSLRPDRADSQYNIGVALSRSGDVEGAIEAYNKTLEIDPDYGDAHFNLAGLHAGRASAVKDSYRDFMRAELGYREVLRIDPGDADTLVALGSLLARQQRYGEAIPVFESALRTDPRHPRAGRYLETAKRLLEERTASGTGRDN